MIYFNVLGHHFLILSSFERTTDLFEKRSSNYSDRTRLPMLLELYVSDFLHLKPCENNACFRAKMYFNFSILPYGEGWRRHRRTFHQYFNKIVVSKYMPIQRREVHAFLRRLLDTPDNFFQHVRQYVLFLFCDFTG
jgi:cytochrome P450